MYGGARINAVKPANLRIIVPRPKIIVLGFNTPLLSGGEPLSLEGVLSEDVPAQIPVLDDAREPFLDHRRVHDNGFLRRVGGVEEDILEEGGHDGVETPGPDVFDFLVDFGRDAGQLAYAVVAKVQGHAVGFEKSGVLFYERVLRECQDFDEVFFGQGVPRESETVPEVRGSGPTVLPRGRLRRQ